MLLSQHEILCSVKSCDMIESYRNPPEIERTAERVQSVLHLPLLLSLLLPGPAHRIRWAKQSAVGEGLLAGGCRPREPPGPLPEPRGTTTSSRSVSSKRAGTEKANTGVGTDVGTG